jgi:Omp85 superfamily domain
VPILGCLQQGKETLITERFHLGGIGMLRGFQYKGVGERAKRRVVQGAPSGSSPGMDALGGDIFARIRAAVCCHRYSAAAVLRRSGAMPAVRGSCTLFGSS